MRKPRSDAKLMSLPQEQQVQIATWLTIDNKSYAQVAKLVASKIKVKTSVGALQNFYSQFAAPWKYTQAKGEADAFAQLMEGQFDEASIKRARQLAFEAMSGPRPDLKAAKSLLKIVGDSAKVDIAKQKLGLDARKVALLEAKAELADKAKAVTEDSELTDEQRMQRLRQIFGGS
jgi:hypothetical protein